MKTKHIVVIVVIILLAYLLIKNNKEGLDTTPTLSNEAIQSISSIYSNTTGTAAFNKIKGKLVSPDSKVVLGFDASGNLCIYDDKNNKIGTVVIKDNSGNITAGDINVTGNISVTGDAIITGTSNTGTNRVRIGVNKNGDGATSTLKNIGIYSEDKTSNTIGKLQVNNFELGRKEASGDVTGMTPDKKYDYVRSNLKSSAFINKDQTGTMNLMWNDSKLYTTWLFNNSRHSSTYGNERSSDSDS